MIRVRSKRQALRGRFTVPGVLALLFLGALIAHPAGAADRAVEASGLPSPTSVSRPSGAPSGAPAQAVDATPTPSVAIHPVPITADEAKRMEREFLKAQRAELRALQDRQKREMRDLDVSQRRQQKEWDDREKEKRRKFFRESTRGSEKRAYMQDLKSRRENFLKLLADEARSRSRENEVHLKSFREDQAARLKEFQNFIKRRETPPAQLWPAR